MAERGLLVEHGQRTGIGNHRSTQLRFLRWGGARLRGELRQGSFALWIWIRHATASFIRSFLIQGADGFHANPASFPSHHILWND
ncbi:hypothetical protein [Xanthomonas fragariae]|uniref:hypothetical protein n=1 Tax=Xanthomonas fragariae TaxID=48664 RepID=UPI001ABE619F|nr:hypothetical protein [Xanthomonas fragariae]UKR53710.1 hypothetical protein K4A87_07550 [Xanthomonas fragariae]